MFYCESHQRSSCEQTVTSGVVGIVTGDSKPYVVALPSTLLGLQELKGIEKIRDDENTKVLSEVVKQYCMANFSIFHGTDEFGTELDPLVRDLVHRHLHAGTKNGLCPASPKMGMIAYLK